MLRTHVVCQIDLEPILCGGVLWVTPTSALGDSNKQAATQTSKPARAAASQPNQAAHDLWQESQLQRPQTVDVGGTQRCRNINIPKKLNTNPEFDLYLECFWKLCWGSLLNAIEDDVGRILKTFGHHLDATEQLFAPESTLWKPSQPRLSREPSKPQTKILNLTSILESFWQPSCITFETCF